MKISFDGLCTIIFIALLIAKLVGWIAWSWWLVFTPLLLVAGIYILVIIVLVVVAVIFEEGDK